MPSHRPSPVKVSKLGQRGIIHFILPIAFIVLFACIGTYVYVKSHAASLPPMVMKLQSNETTPTHAALTWSPATAPGITGYEVFRNGTEIAQTDQYTTNYLDSGLTSNTAYKYRISALNSSGTVQTSYPFTVQSAGSTQTISSCNYEQPLSSGNYVLTSDLTTSDKNGCLSFSGAKELSLDCQGHSISDTWLGGQILNISGTAHFLIVNCVFSDPTGTNYTYIDNSNYGTVANNNFQTPASTSSAGSFAQSGNSNVITNDNTFSNVAYTQTLSSNNYVGHNNISTVSTGTTIYADVWINGGNNNIVDTNTIHGSTVAPDSTLGTDDGVILGYSGGGKDTIEHGDIVVNNKISNVFDAGIETCGLLKNSLVKGNTIYNAAKDGIGTYYSTSWINNQVIGNKVSHTPHLFDFEEATTQLPYGQSVFYFKNNAFTSNVFDPANLPVSDSTSFINLEENGITPVASKDVFTSNNFGHILETPPFDPTSMVVDGGGNICIPEIKLKNFHCH